VFSYLSRFPHSTHRREFAEQAPLRSYGVGGALLLGTLVLLCLPVASARAALVSTGSCSNAALSQPFAQWGDTNSYELLPGGDFEGSLAQWTLNGGAARGSGSEPYGVSGSVGQYSLALPAGASAQSSYVCVNASYPTFRLFARATGLLSSVVVQVVYKTALGPIVLPVGALTPSDAWQPTPPLLTGSVAAGLLSNGTAQVALRFTELTGSSEIDDVFVDPRMR
jgi:hypothetical protein